MLFLLIRLTIAPLAVIAGTIAQRRFGHAVSGLIIGLPLTSLPMLALVDLQHGTSFAVSMSNADLIGSLAEVAVMMAYVILASRCSPAVTLVSAVGVFVAVAGVLNQFSFSTLLAGVLAIAAFSVALRYWPRRAVAPVEEGRQRLVLRVALSGGFTFALISTAGAVGPGLAGLAAAFPIMSMVMAFVTHQEHGASASMSFLQGVAKGSFSYVASIFTFTMLLASSGVWVAFTGAFGVALLVQLIVQLIDTTPRVKRLLNVTLLNPRVALES